MIQSEIGNIPFKLKDIFDNFNSLPTQNQRILFFDDPKNIDDMSEFDINIENCKKAQIEIWNKAFPKKKWPIKE